MLTEGMHLTPLHTLGSSVLGRAGVGLFPSQGKVSCWSVVCQGLSVHRVWGEGPQAFLANVWGAEPSWTDKPLPLPRLLRGSCSRNSPGPGLTQARDGSCTDLNLSMLVDPG